MMYYSSRWQLIEERIDEDSSFTTDPESGDIERHVHYVWGNRYIDDCILHNEVDKNPIDRYGFGGTWYHITDVQFSTVAILDSSAALVERTSYDAYGKGRHHYMADIDGSGGVDSAEILSIRTIGNGSNHAIGEANYNVDMDINRDGDVTQHFDYNIANSEGTHAALAAGLISQPKVDNQVGWDGYLFNAETSEYSVRYRNYSPVQGRWLERDPAGYVDGGNLYEAVRGHPINGTDPYGMQEGGKEPPTSQPSTQPSPQEPPAEQPSEPDYQDPNRWKKSPCKRDGKFEKGKWIILDERCDKMCRKANEPSGPPTPDTRGKPTKGNRRGYSPCEDGKRVGCCICVKKFRRVHGQGWPPNIREIGLLCNLTHEETHHGQPCEGTKGAPSSDCRECEAYKKSRKCLEGSRSACTKPGINEIKCNKFIDKELKYVNGKIEKHCPKCPGETTDGKCS